MRFFLALFVVLLVAGCNLDNPIRSGPTDAPSRITLDDDGDDTTDTTDLQLPTRFENPLSSFDFNTLSGDRDLEPDEVLDPDGVGTLPDDTDVDVDDGDGLEPEVIDDDSDDDPDPDPEVVDDDDDSDDDFGADEVVE